MPNFLQTSSMDTLRIPYRVNSFPDNCMICVLISSIMPMLEFGCKSICFMFYSIYALMFFVHVFFRVVLHFAVL